METKDSLQVGLQRWSPALSPANPTEHGVLMSAPQTARQALDRHYLEIRCRILDLAATLDRIDRVAEDDSVEGDPRLQLIREGLEIVLSQDGFDRAERVQMLFSDRYEPDWRRKYAMPARS